MPDRKTGGGTEAFRRNRKRCFGCRRKASLHGSRYKMAWEGKDAGRIFLSQQSGSKSAAEEADLATALQGCCLKTYGRCQLLEVSAGAWPPFGPMLRLSSGGWALASGSRGLMRSIPVKNVRYQKNSSPSSVVFHRSRAVAWESRGGTLPFFITTQPSVISGNH